MTRLGEAPDFFDTHYIYSPSGLLMIVIQPEGVERLSSEYFGEDAEGKGSFLNRWCFMYHYDDKQRIIERHLPGWEDPITHKATWAYAVYDKWNRVVLTQIPMQTARGEWLFKKYDQFNRVIVTGLFNSESDRESLQASVNAHYANNPTNRFEFVTNNSIGYTLDRNFPVDPEEPSLIAVNYYDSYAFRDFINWCEPSTTLNYQFQDLFGFPQSSEALQEVRGYQTGSKIRVLGTATWLRNVYYYDGKYQTIQSIAENYIGGWDRLTSNFDFVGKILKSQLNHSSQNSSLSILREFEYDHAQRPLRIFQTTNGGTKTLLVSNRYNEIGQLIEKNIHSTDDGLSFLQSIDFRHNIRGWLTSINNSTLTNDGIVNDDSNDLFGMEVAYNPISPTTVNGYTTPRLFDGNIGSIKWKIDTKVGTTEERIFGFEYDVLNRLKKSYYATNSDGAWVGNPGLFDEQISSYDKNGNINGIIRKGLVDGAPTTIDNLTYSYSQNGVRSNRLTAVTDEGNQIGFMDGAAVSEEYLYDASGNLNFDNNKQISTIVYNHLNLPEMIEFLRPNGQIDRIRYTYAANGTKLRTEVEVDQELAWSSDYVGDVQYDNGELSFASTPEGRVVKNSIGFDYEYFYKDHQDNVRLTYGNLKETISFKASMEDPGYPSLVAEEEQAIFKNIGPNETRHEDTPGENFNYTKSSERVTHPNKSSETNASNGKAIGMATSFNVSSGDKVRMSVFAKYTTMPGSSATIGDAALIAAVASSTFGISAGEMPQLYSGFTAQVPFIPGSGTGSSTLPQAYLAFLFFSDASPFTFITSGAVSISSAAFDSFEKLERTFTAEQDGILYVYVVNETNAPSGGGSVYFDEMSIVHQKTGSTLQVTQASDYYPFGLQFNKYLADRIDEDFRPKHKNRYSFQGQEWQSDLGLNWSQFKWRMHDPAIGRFFSTDPLAEKYLSNGPYVFSENKVTNHLELEGLEGLPAGFRMMRSMDTEAQMLKRYEDALNAGNFAVAMEAYNSIKTMHSSQNTLVGGSIALLSLASINWTGLARFLVTNPILVTEGTSAVAGLFYDGPEDLCPGCKGDDLAKVLRGGGRKVLDFFGGPTSRYSFALNIDLAATLGYKGSIKEFHDFMKARDLFGTIDNIIADNPRDFFITEAAQMLRDGGVLAVRGTISNPYFNEIWKLSDEKLRSIGFEVVKRMENIPKEGMRQSDGITPIRGKVNEIILRKIRTGD